MAKAQTKVKLHNFIWSGTNHKGVKDNGEIEAASIRLARMLLRQKGINVKKVRKEAKPLFGGPKVTNRDIVVLTRQLATMVEGGIPIAQSITAVAQSSENPAVRKLLSNMRRRVDSGENLTSTLKHHPKHFNQLYIGLVTVGEESGTLGPMLIRIAAYLEKSEALRRKIKSAMMYPVIVFGLGMLIAAGLLIFIIPQFQTLFNDFGAELPALTKYVIKASEFVQAQWFFILAGMVIFFYVYRSLYRSSEAVLYATDKMVLKIPVFGPLIRKSVLARISRTIAIMFRAGIPLVETLGTIAPAAGNYIYTKGLAQVRTDISTGQPLESSMRDTKLFPSMVLQMVRTGEETGEMDSMLDKAADYYEDEVDNTVDSISSLVEPMLVVVLGIMIGTVVIAMYLPIFNLGSVF
ncbi:MAG: type II secretion system F family protein [Arenicellales bacterium]